MQSDNRPRVFAADEESEKQRDRLATMQRELAIARQNIANAEADLDRWHREADELEAGIAAIVAIRSGQTPPEPVAAKVERPSAKTPKAAKAAKAPRAKRVYLHPQHSTWHPAEVMRIFDTMQAATTPKEINQAIRNLADEFDVSDGAIKHQWQNEQRHRGLR